MEDGLERMSRSHTLLGKKVIIPTEKKELHNSNGKMSKENEITKIVNSSHIERQSRMK